MKFTWIIMSAVALSSASALAANGVEKVLPSDAHDVQIQSVKLGYTQTGERAIDTGIDGPWYDPIFSHDLEVTVTYRSTDNADLPPGSGPNEEVEPWDHLIPTLYFSLPVTDAEVAAIQSRKLDPNTLVSMSVAQARVQIEDPNYQYKCSYDVDGHVMNGCVEPPVPMITVVRPVLTITGK